MAESRRNEWRIPASHVFDDGWWAQRIWLAQALASCLSRGELSSEALAPLGRYLDQVGPLLAMYFQSLVLRAAGGFEAFLRFARERGYTVRIGLLVVHAWPQAH